MEDIQYDEIVAYLQLGDIPERVTNKSNWRQKTRNFVLGDSTKYGALYKQKITLKTSCKPFVTLKKDRDWKEGEDYKILQEPCFKLQQVIRLSQCNELVSQSHLVTCHGGRNSMRYQLKDCYIERKESWIKKLKVCNECDALKALPEQLPYTPIYSKSPGERIQFDFTFYQAATIFTVIDHFSKFAFAYTVASRKTSVVIELLEESIRKLKKNREVIISILQSDNGAEFCSKKMKEFCSKNNYSLIHGRVRHPQSQGCIERFHRTLKTNLMLLQKTGKNLEHSLKLAVKAYNNSFHHTVFFTF